MSIKSQATEQRLRDALKRLLEGTPERTKADNKINLSRINREAGCSHGLIYSYPLFISDAKIEITKHKNKLQQNLFQNNIYKDSDKISKLKSERIKQEQLKCDYRNQRDHLQSLSDAAVKRENELLFRCFELQIELSKLRESNVIDLNDKD
ncbi:hypothetical protein [Aeromonas hydrophila]|uniref:hypothetical protein n=1 Tax=Aeromonas hydrophila TaxID=644 RepID=UPI002B48CDA0|nr:hypothetical protein [Aeromonas hydrophila]